MPARRENPDQPTYEEALAEVEAIIERIESGRVGLEESLAEYEKGVELLRRCREVLGRVEQRVEDLTRRLLESEEGGTPPAEPGA
jgi:exodeoxyribonuclease VII small subunit